MSKPELPKRASLRGLTVEDALRAAMQIDPSKMPRTKPKAKPAKSSKKARKKR